MYGSELKYYPRMSRFARLYTSIFGNQFIGEYIRWLYFKKNINGMDFSNKRILDAGCGGGPFSFYIAKKFPSAKIDAFDFEGNTIENNKIVSRKLGVSNINFFRGMLENFYTKNKYDFIICIEVLEHIEEDTKAIQNIYNSLKKGGIVFIHVPRKTVKYYFRKYKMTKGHVRHGYELNELRRMLKNFTILKYGYSTGPWCHFLWELNGFGTENNYLRSITAPILKPLMHLEMLFENKEGNSVFMLAKKE